jgi:hypothetical protein
MINKNLYEYVCENLSVLYPIAHLQPIEIKEAILNAVIEGYSTDYAKFSMPILTANVFECAIFMGVENLLPEKLKKHITNYKQAGLQRQLKENLIKKSYFLASEKSGETSFDFLNSESHDLIKECFSICFENLTSEQKIFLNQKFEFPIFVNNC